MRWLWFSACIALASNPGEVRAGVRVRIEGLEDELKNNAEAMVTLTRAKDDWPEGQIKRLHRQLIIFPREIDLADAILSRRRLIRIGEAA